jgi:hypothetical protein
MTDVSSGDGPNADAPKEEPRPESTTDVSKTEESAEEAEQVEEDAGGASSDDKGKAIAPDDSLPNEPDPGAEEGQKSEAEDDEEEEDEDEDGDDDQEEEEEEPRLKYARLTQHLGPVYRNGDATSAFLVAGDKMVCLGCNIAQTTR